MGSREPAENEFVPRDLPGPGKYEPQLPVEGKQFNSTGNYSIFSSKVPNCKDAKIKSASLPGPGLYDSKMVKHGDPSSLGSKQGASTEESSQMSAINQNPFMSTVGRVDHWKAELNAPYTK